MININQLNELRSDMSTFIYKERRLSVKPYGRLNFDVHEQFETLTILQFEFDLWSLTCFQRRTRYELDSEWKTGWLLGLCAERLFISLVLSPVRERDERAR